MELQLLGLPPTIPRKRTRRSSGGSSQFFIVATLLVLAALSWLGFSSPFEANRRSTSQRVGSVSSTTEKEEYEGTTNKVDERRPLPSRFPRQTLRTAHDSSEAPREQGVYGRSHLDSRVGPYHDWELFQAGFDEMSRVLKIFVYRDAFLESAPFANVFLPHPDPFNPKLGNYFSEHMFKINLLRSSFLTSRPEDAHLFFLPFSINAMRNDPRVRSEPSIANFVANYTNRISQEARFWNASAGSDHFYVCCHSVGRFAASKHSQLHTSAMQVSCSSSYFQRLYISHKDVGLPQVWPRPPEPHLNPPHAR